MDRTDAKPSLRSGDRVEVKTRYCGGWASGFEVADTSDDGCRLRRVSDGVVLPAVFRYDDLRAACDPEPDNPIEYDLRFTADRARLFIRLPPTLDIATVEAVRAPLLSAVDSAGEEVVVDLNTVDFLDSYGIRLLMTLSRRAWKRDVPTRLHGGKPPIRALLDLVAIDPLYHPEQREIRQHFSAREEN